MIKIITGFRENQYYTIDEKEAHKAYYLFLNPEKRGVFENGVALIGKNIQGIEPDWNATMGWNPTHELDNDDWNDIRSKGVDKKIKKAIADAKVIAHQIAEKPELLNLTLQEALQENAEDFNTENLRRIEAMR